MNVPYNTGKVKIGSNYTKPLPQETDGDMLRIQTALIGDRGAMRNYMIEKMYAWSVGFILLVLITYHLCRT
jgi:hypothetical protein